jgi:hypothetical protein
VRPSAEGFDRYDALLLASGTLALAAFVVAEAWIAGAPGLPLDDSWIHLRLADNLSTGGGFAINPGELVAVSTAPIWTVALACLLALGVPGLAAAKALGVACWAATGLVTRRLATAAELPAGLSWVAGLAVLTLGRLVWGALSGMEVPLAALCVAAASWAIARDRSLLGAAGLGLATLARPEAGLLVVLHALGGGRWSAMLRRLVVAAAVLAPSIAFNVIVGGRLVPNTAAAKVEGGLLGQMEGVAAPWALAHRFVWFFFREWGKLLFLDHVALPVLLVVGLYAVRASRLRWLAAALILHPIASALVAPYRSPIFQTGRYSTHLLPLAVVVALIGLERFWRRLPTRRLRVAVAALLLVALVAPVPGGAWEYAWAVQNINAMQVTLGHWVAGHTPPDTLIAVNDLGALSYFGRRRVIDLRGLGTPEILPYRRQGEMAILGYLGRRCPEYLIVFPEWYRMLTARDDLFRPIAGVKLPYNVVSGADTMLVYETVWHRGHQPAPLACPAPWAG